MQQDTNTIAQSVIDYFNISKFCMDKVRKFAMKSSYLILRKIVKIVAILIKLIIFLRYYGLCAEYFSQNEQNPDNTFPPNITGNPALSINAGFSSSEPHLPVGMMMIGRHFEDSMVLRLAHAYERLRNASSVYSDMETRLRAAMKSQKY